jgi:CCR4-NOT transcription complex subunit 9
MLQHQMQQNSMQAHDSRYEYSTYQNAMIANQNLLQQQQLQQAKKFNSEQLAQKSLQAEERIYALILDLMNPNLREQALLELSKKREMYDDLAIILWHSYGKISHDKFDKRR